MAISTRLTGDEYSVWYDNFMVLGAGQTEREALLNAMKVIRATELDVLDRLLALQSIQTKRKGQAQLPLKDESMS